VLTCPLMELIYSWAIAADITLNRACGCMCMITGSLRVCLSALCCGSCVLATPSLQAMLSTPLMGLKCVVYSAYW
jgi:hypothetical protein